MARTIDQRVDEIIGREGNYSNLPADRGGPTRWGITQQTARAYGYRGDMAALPRETAVGIYKARYWTGPKFDLVDSRLPALADELFDGGVNMGPGRAVGFLQRALNLLNRGGQDYADIAADGAIGPMTLHALDRYIAKRGTGEGAAVLLWMVRAFRTGRYAEIAEASPSQEAFEYGWIARQVRAAA